MTANTTANGRTLPATHPPIVSPEAWEAARQQMLVKEKAHTRAGDALAAERRRMPWMTVEKAYEFEGPSGKVSLLDLFEERRQLMGTVWSYLDVTALGRQEIWEVSPESYPQSRPYKWWNWHDSYVADAAPDPGWVEVSDAGEAVFRHREAEAKP